VKDYKPGQDYYLIQVVLQMLILVFTLLFFTSVKGEKEELKQTLQFKTFGVQMVMFICGQIFLILLDRYFYISSTFIEVK